MWTCDLSDCWLNTPDVCTSDDDNVRGLSATDHVVFDEPPRLSFHPADITFQPTTHIPDSFSPITSIPLPVLQFHGTEAPLEEQLVTPEVLTKTTQPDLNITTPGWAAISPTTFSSPPQQHFMLISSDDLISILSLVNNNNEFVLDNNSSSEIHHHQQEPTSENHISTDTAAAGKCAEYQLHTSGDETGSDVTRLSKDDLMRMLDDASSVVVSNIVTAALEWLHLADEQQQSPT